MSEQPEILQLAAAWQSKLPDKERKMTVLASCWEQWMQLERDKAELRNMTNNQIRSMTSWQKNIARQMERLFVEVTSMEREE